MLRHAVVPLVTLDTQGGYVLGSARVGCVVMFAFCPLARAFKLRLSIGCTEICAEGPKRGQNHASNTRETESIDKEAEPAVQVLGRVAVLVKHMEQSSLAAVGTALGTTTALLAASSTCSIVRSIGFVVVKLVWRLVADDAADVDIQVMALPFVEGGGP